MPAIPANSSNAWALWQAGVMAATNLGANVNLPRHSQNPLYQPRPVLLNTALKAGFNAVRLFMDLWPLQAGPQGVHEVDKIAQLGWDDTTTSRKSPLHGWVEDELLTFKALAQQIDRVLAQCQQAGLGVILSLGFYHSEKMGSLWQDPARHDLLVKFWAQTAQRWPQHPALIGLELLNEPSPGFKQVGGEVRGMFHSEMRSRPGSINTNDYKTLMERCIAAIRRYNKDTPVVVSGIHGAHPDGFDYFRVKTSPDPDFEAHNTVAPSSWPASRPPLVHGRNPWYGRPQTAAYSKTDRSMLVADPAARVVYTFHMYMPYMFTMQGVEAWVYHMIGVQYPKGNAPGETFLSTELDWRDGLHQVREFDFSKGGEELARCCTRAAAFRQDFGVPVFMGEFSAASLEFISMLPDAMPDDVRGDDSPVRHIVGLSCKNGVATALLRKPLAMHFENFVDDRGRPYAELDTLLRIHVKDDAKSPFNVAEVPVKLRGHRYAPDAPSKFHRSDVQTFSFALPGVKSARLGLDTQSSPFEAAQAPTVAHFATIITPELIDKNRISRVTYIRDVLRMAHQLGFSWAWFADYQVPMRGDYRHEFWRVDKGGQIRALLRRAASQSYE